MPLIVAALGLARPAPASYPRDVAPPRLRARRVRRRRLFLRHHLLDRRGRRDLRRAAARGGAAVRAGAGALHDRLPGGGHGAARRRGGAGRRPRPVAGAGRCGWPASSPAATCWAASRGCRWAAAWRRCCRWPSWPASSGVYGLSLYLVAHSTLVALAITGTTRQRVRGGGRRRGRCCSPCRSGAACGCRHAALTREGTPITLGLIQANIRQEEKWDPAMAATITRRYDALTRRAAAAGAAVVLWPESATPYYFNEEPQRAEEVRRWSARSARRCSSAPTRSNAARPTALLQLGVHARSRRRRGRRLPQDQAGAVRRVRAAALAAVLRLAAGRGRVGFSRRRPGDDAADGRAHGQHGHLLRDRLSGPRPRGRAPGRRAAHHRHQRRLVRRLVGAVPALRAGLAAGHRAGPLSGPRRQHRHQRRGRSLRPGDRRHRRVRRSGGASPRCAS